MRTLFNNCFIGIGISALIASISSIAYEVSNGGQMESTSYFFTKMVIGCIVIGIGWGAPACLYESEKRSMLQNCIMHILIGCTAMLITSYAAGWLPRTRGPVILITAMAIQICIAMIIWIVSYMINKKMAAQMNERLRQMSGQK